jgi:hypothetical protein
MLQLKTRKELIYNSYTICLISKCKEESTKMWATESNIIDVCSEHYRQLDAEKFTT